MILLPAGLPARPAQPPLPPMPTAPVLDYFFTGAVLAFYGDIFAGFLSLSIPNEQNPLKEQIIHGRSYKNLAQLRAAVATFVPIYNHHWRLEKLRYQSPIEARIAFQSTMPLAA
jgi:transposase InsO family protein